MKALLLAEKEFRAEVAKIDAMLGYPNAETKTNTYADLPEPDENGLYELPITEVFAPKLGRIETAFTSLTATQKGKLADVRVKEEVAER